MPSLNTRHTRRRKPVATPTPSDTEELLRRKRQLNYMIDGWLAAIATEGLDITKLFLTVECLNAGADREPDHVWWPVTELSDRYIETVEHWLQVPASRGLVGRTPFAEPCAPEILIDALAAVKDDATLIATVMLAAASYEIQSPAGRYAPRPPLETLDIDMAREVWRTTKPALDEKSIYSAWRYPMKYVLPDQFMWTAWEQIQEPATGDDLSKFVCRIGKTHAAFFRQWQAVEVIYPEKLSPEWQSRHDAIQAAL